MKPGDIQWALELARILIRVKNHSEEGMGDLALSREECKHLIQAMQLLREGSNATRRDSSS